MVCIVNYRIITFVPDEFFKEFEESLAIALSSMLRSQPNFVKLDEIFLSSKKLL